MVELFLILAALLGLGIGYTVSHYSLAVHIDPEEVENLFPNLSRRRQAFLARLTEDPGTFRQVATIFKALVLIIVSAIACRLAGQLAVATNWTWGAAAIPSLFVAWLLYLLAVEYLPRRFARENSPDKLIRRLWLIRIVYALLLPLAVAYRRLIGGSRVGHELTEEEREDLVERAIDSLADDAGIGQSIVEDEEKEMIGQILLLDQTTVREIMVPRIDITAIEHSMTFGQIRELVSRDGHSRYPVYKGNIDQVAGLIYVKDLFNRMPEPGEKFDLDRFLRKPFLIPETKIIGELLREFQLRRQHLAIVVDEYGGVAGLVTLEDIMEEVFGEIRDEHDFEEEEILKLPDGRHRVSASLMVERLQDELDTDYESGDHDTVGGLIYDLVGSVPRQGQTVRWHGLEFEVERVSGQRIISVLVRR